MSHINFRSVFQHLYVLYLGIPAGNLSVVFVPDAIGSLYHLKFLSLKGIRDVPSSIGNLKNLQTLVVNVDGYTCKLPRETADLINLRHLLAPYYSKPLVHISNLTSLQVLKGVGCDQWKDVDPVDLVNLRELSMDDIKKSYSLTNIRSLENLSSLRLFCGSGESFPDLEFVNCCEKLQILRLYGRMEKLPDHLFPNSITMMVLNFSVLTEDPMPILGMLPNLRNLDLLRAYEGKEIMCCDNSFSQLEFLILRKLEKLERWDLGTNAMPLIKGLGVHDCPNLKEIPERMKYVELLKRSLKNNATIQCDDHGAEFFEVEINSSMDKVINHPDLTFLQGLSCRDSSSSTFGPLTLAQLSHFECGGIALSFCMLHKVGDACNAYFFLRDWARLTRDPKSTLSPPYFAKDSLMPSPFDGPLVSPVV
ncbi:disease resistance protein RPH8A-like [Solanum verrucosum]|uniref:disease resistance protein RPH8A-like n=1 Tax=Solanum verrucosum TaxID=315347 RepID=UPI0020CFFB07|nr:disease resistance protein RPH8A-like [Solanum verrucosum]